MLTLLASGRFDIPPPAEAGPGLVHEPSPGEVPPEGYVEAHEHVDDLDLPVDDLPVDPDGGPGFPE